MRTGRRRFLAAAVLAAAAAAVLAAAHPASAAPDVNARRVVGDLDAPVAFTFGPGGVLWYVEKDTGEIRTYDLDSGRDSLFDDVPGVNGQGERGMLGIALHPRYPQAPYVYVYVTRSVRGRLRNQILRIPDRDGAGARRVIFSSPASASAYHNGGRILFGPDGMLYAIVGDGHDASKSQDLSDDRGKILRMTPTGDGTSPGDDLILAYGIRNSFGFAFDPRTDRLWETENGPACNDELNRIRAERNYGWGPSATCEGASPGNTNRDGPRPILPELYYEQPIGITGIAFCEACGLGSSADGRAFFGSVNTGEITRVAFDAGRSRVRGRTVVYTHERGVISIEVAPSGSLFFSDMTGIWRLTRD
jgi:quinoprotein glucose dehydrogenase